MQIIQPPQKKLSSVLLVVLGACLGAIFVLLVLFTFSKVLRFTAHSSPFIWPKAINFSKNLPKLLPTPTPNLTLNPLDPQDIVPGKLAYITHHQIWTINTDRTENTQITNDDTEKFFLSLSPDGTKAAYSFYPTNEKDRSDKNMYAGFNSGIAVVDITTKEVNTLIPYDNIQNYYPTWSPDGTLLSIWVGTGKKALLIDSTTGVEKLSYATEASEGASLITWLPNSHTISFILKGELFTADEQGNNVVKITDTANSFTPAFESPPSPANPHWSHHHRFVTYLKNFNFMVRNQTTGEEIMIVPAETDSPMAKRVAAGHTLGFNQDDTQLYYMRNNSIETLNLNTALNSIIATGSAALLSPNTQSIIANNIYDTSIYAAPTFRPRHCLKTPIYNSNDFIDKSWSPGSNAVTLRHSSHYKRGVYSLVILNTETCGSYEIVKTDDSIGDAAWFPQSN